MPHALSGIYPVVITPFQDGGAIDWEGYEALLEWYIGKGASGLFAVCQSSEMQFLSLEERRDLARFTVAKVAGRIPVVASGHISGSEDDQKAELRAAAEAGVDAVVLVTNRLDPDQTGGSTLTDAITRLLAALPADLTLGLYECPAPYRRLLTDDELRFCADSGRFAFLKDVSCDLDVVKRRLSLTRGTPLAINNANAAIAWPVLQAGGHGFSGVMNNFHPDLYRWLADHGANHLELAGELNTFLVLSALSESLGYPKLAKEYHRRIGTFKSTHSRAVPFDIFERFWGLAPILDQIMTGADHFRTRIAAL